MTTTAEPIIVMMCGVSQSFELELLRVRLQTNGEVLIDRVLCASHLL